MLQIESDARAPLGRSGGLSRSQQETENRLESGLRPVFKIENLQPATQFRAKVFAKVNIPT